MLPPISGSLPRAVARIRPGRLSVGDIVYLETASAGAPVRSLILGIRGQYFQVMNRLQPEPYEVFLPDSKEVLALKVHPSRPRAPSPESHAQSYRRKRGYARPLDDDPRSYWNWDPRDPRVGTDFHSVEEKDWKRLNSWWESQAPKKQQKKAPGPKIDRKAAEWYSLLGVRAGVTLKELKSAYKKMAFKYHPDRCKDSNAEETFKKVSAAFQGLQALITRK